MIFDRNVIDVLIVCVVGVFLTRTLKQKSSCEIRHVLGVVIWKVQYRILDVANNRPNSRFS